MTAVADTSPLVALSRLGLLYLLPALFQDVLVPPAVRREAIEAQPDATDAVAIREALNAGWLAERQLVNASSVGVLTERLGRGEPEAIALAQESAADVLLLDESPQATRWQPASAST